MTAIASRAEQFDADRVAAALAAADPNPLRVALYQATGNPALARMRVQRVEVRGGAAVELRLNDEDQALLRELASEFLRHRDEWVEPAPPTREQTAELVGMLAARELHPDELAMSIEELAFEEFPRAVEWSAGRPAAALAGFHVVVVGAGISGITMGIQLERLGIPYTLIERQHGIGGTWQRNRYPDIRVDTPCTGYQFKFVKDFRWSEYYPGRQEVAAYLGMVAERYGVAPHVRFGCELVSAAWDQESGKWTLEVRREGVAEPEVLVANVVVTGCGLFNVARMPNLPGVEQYQGQLIHPTQWAKGTEITGKRVAVIGNGSTGVQVMPKLAEDAASLTAFVRTPSWIRPSPLYKKLIPDEVGFLLDNIPYYRDWQVCATFVGGDSRLSSEALRYDPEWQARGGIISEQNDRLREWLTGYVEEKLATRPELIRHLVPSYAPLGRRMVVDNGWYDALLRDNVELVVGGIERFTQKGIVGADGIEREFDVVVSATGYAVQEYLWPAVFTGRDGRTLSEVWGDGGPRAYLGMTVPGFPNLFIMYGPNGQPRAGNFHSWAEITSRYVAQGIVELVERSAVSLEVRPEVYATYNQRLDQEFKKIIWSTEGGRGYFAVEEGKGSVSMPWEHYEYFALIRQIDLGDFTVEEATAPH
ncbi:flavin-containing monooxygenase [Pseudonocardia sp. GCM10023141]|uniref:flavin-containing monooxygenase n=1 Tax=Pseudonocardia sp. GCM10023141 TaxID=3252653 RepID=UPI003623F016